MKADVVETYARQESSLCLLQCRFAAFIEYDCGKKVLCRPGNSVVRQLGRHDDF